MRAIASDTGTWSHMAAAVLFTVCLVPTVVMVLVALVALARHRAGLPGWLWESPQRRLGILVQHGTEATWTVLRSRRPNPHGFPRPITGLVLVVGPLVVTVSRYPMPQVYRHQVAMIESLLGVTLPQWQRNLAETMLDPDRMGMGRTMRTYPCTPYRAANPERIRTVVSTWVGETSHHYWTNRPNPTPRPGRGRPTPLTRL